MVNILQSLYSSRQFSNQDLLYLKNEHKNVYVYLTLIYLKQFY